MSASPLSVRIRQTFQADPAGRAIEFDGVWHGWDAVAASAKQLDDLLNAAGMGAGAPVGLVIRNRPALLAALYGLLATDRCAALVSALQGPERIRADLEQLGVPAVLADAEGWAVPGFAEAAGAAGMLGVLLPDRPGDRPSLVAGLEQAGPGGHRREAPGIAIELLTSGTTGKPKRVPISAHAVLDAGIDAGRLLDHEDDLPADAPRDTVIQLYPLTNIAGLYWSFASMLDGRPLALLDKFAVDDWSAAMRRHRPRVTSIPPAAIRMIVEADADPDLFRGVLAVRNGAAPLDADLRGRFEQRYGAQLLSHYGATEYCGVVASWTLAEARDFPEIARNAGLGRPRPGVSFRVVEPGTDRELPPGEEGILHVRADRLGPDWVRTNDLARVDADGFLFLGGRADDVINRGGFKMAPDTIADALRQHPAILDVCVVGLPDERLGQVPVAAVELRPGATPPDDAELAAFARARLTAFQVPARILVVKALPRTPTLKLIRPEVRALFQ